MRQTSFGFFKNYAKSFGGSQLVGRRKTARPLSTKSPVHLILKSETQKIFRPNNQSLNALILATAKQFNIQIREYVLNWSHIHLLIQIKNRKDYVRFIRALTSKLSMAARKAKAKIEKLFTLRPFTRIVNWGRDYQNVIIYSYKNFRESIGAAEKKESLPVRQFVHQKSSATHRLSQPSAPPTDRARRPTNPAPLRKSQADDFGLQADVSLA